MSKVVISLFDHSGIWCKPYRDAGYTVHQVDIQLGSDVYDSRLEDLENVHGVLAAPPCTDFALSGARWFAAKDADGRTGNSVKLVARTLDLIERWQPSWWALENPASRIHSLVPRLGAPRFKYHPYQFGDPYRKQTWLWGQFTNPRLGPVVEPQGVRVGQPDAWYSSVGGSSIKTKNFRSRTSVGFSIAWFLANP